MHAMKMRASLCALLGLLVPIVAMADADSARNKGAAWLVKQQRGDGSWANSNGELGVQATSAALLALKNAGLAKSPTFGTAASWLANSDADSIDSIARKVEALTAAGMPGSSQTEADRLYGLRSLSTSATWGGYGSSSVDYLDTALGLTALRLADASYSAKVSGPILQAFCNLATARVSVAAGKQAWPTTKASINQSAAQGRPSVIATALVLNELPGMQKATNFGTVTCGTGSFTFAALQSEAQAWLLDQQNADGGFGEQRTDGSKGNSSVLVSALVHRALNSQTTPVQPQTGNAQAWLLAQQDATSGSWRNDPLVTASVLAVLPAAAGTQLADTDSDGVTNLVEAQLGSNPTVADARGQLGSPTLASPGYTATSFAASAIVGQFFTYSLGSGSTYAIAAGALPPGVSLNAATGLINGTPSQAGSYSFDFSASSAGNTQMVIGRIDVAAVTSTEGGDSDAPLPVWALVLMGAALLGAGAQRRRNAS